MYRPKNHVPHEGKGGGYNVLYKLNLGQADFDLRGIISDMEILLLTRKFFYVDT